MPVYEFYCNKCKYIFEELILNSKEIPHCPKCGNTDIKKQFSLFGFTSGGKTVTSSSSPSCSTCSTRNCNTCG